MKNKRRTIYKALLLCGVMPIFLSSCISSGTERPRAPVIHYGAKSGAGSAGIHTVTRDENIWRIAKNYQLPMRELIVLNNLSAPYVLDVGQRLTLPPPNIYKVKPGDTIYEIARLFSLSMHDLVRLNKLKAPYRIHTGQSLRLPSPYQLARLEARPARRSETVMHMSVAQPAARPQGNAAKYQKPKKAYKKAKIPPRTSGKFDWPLSGKVISSYGGKANGTYNDGINIKAPRGTAVKAVENGVVVYRGDEISGYGNLLLIKHADGWMSAYAHLDQIKVARGQTIKRGSKIATVGMSGNVDAPQLHFELRKGAGSKNPLSYMSKG